MSQPVLLMDLPDLQEPGALPPTRPEVARVVRPVRNQGEMVVRDLDSLVAEDHPVRAIWAFLEGLDLSAFYSSIKAVVDRPGRPASDPEVLLALWVYATAQGIGSARRLARLCIEHDVYRWLCGGVPVDYHLLADFRVNQQEALDDLLTNILGVMTKERLVTLGRVAQDGTRVRAHAGAGSFHRRGRLERCLAAAREQVQRLAQEREHPDPQASRREQAARERAARERHDRVQRALKEVATVEAAKERQQRRPPRGGRERVTEPRASTTDPEARVMRMADGGFRPAYNVQLATDTASQVIVGVDVTQQGSDSGRAAPMEEAIVQRTGVHLKAYLVDGGFVTLGDLTRLAGRGVTVYAPVPSPRRGPRLQDPTRLRQGDTPAVAAWRERMATKEAQEIYKGRGATAECVNAHFLGRYGVRQFLVRGLAKVLCVSLLVAITHNLLRWAVLTR